MKALREIRLVYRQHLLPPLVVPLEKLTDYQKLIDGKRESLQSRRQTRKEMMLAHEINETVVTQIIKIRNNFVLPLQKCPFFYEQLDRYVRMLIEKKQLKSEHYLECMDSVTPDQRRKILRKVENNYKAFRADMEQQNPSFYKHATYIPIFLYQSPADMTLATQGKAWKELSELERVKASERYEAKLNRYWRSLQSIATKSSIQVENLLQLMKSQINPPLSSGLRKLLFPSQLGEQSSGDSFLGEAVRSDNQ